MEAGADILVSVIIPTRDRGERGGAGRELGARPDPPGLGRHRRGRRVHGRHPGASGGPGRSATAGLCSATNGPGGCRPARNTGLAAAGGRYLALLDSDDIWLPTKIERTARFCPGRRVCDLSESGNLAAGRAGGSIPDMGTRNWTAFFFEQALARCLVSPSSVLFTRELLDTVGGFDETLPACEDYDLWLRTLVRYPVGLLNEWLTVRHGGRPGPAVGVDRGPGPVSASGPCSSCSGNRGFPPGTGIAS